ncbi:MAG: cytidine deaminase [bacterium]|nr:cytidine deaminase [bacterium]
MEPERLVDEARKIVGEFRLSNEYSSAGSVGCALITKRGNIYTGICIDLPSGIGFCAEHSAIAEMLKHRETEIEMIVAVTRDSILPPCGRCREMMYQVNKNNLRTKVIVDYDKIVYLEELLPFRWI